MFCVTDVSRNTVIQSSTASITPTFFGIACTRGVVK